MQNISQEYKCYCQADPHDKQSLFSLVDGKDLPWSRGSGMEVSTDSLCQVDL